MRKTLLEVLQAGTDYLAQSAGLASEHTEPRTAMQYLMAHVLQCTRTDLYLKHDVQLDEPTLEQLRILTRRVAAGEPLQHVLGVVEFFRRDFLSDARALIPRPETEELVELILRTVEKRPIICNEVPIRVLDMGSGSGIIGITLALELLKRIPATTPRVHLVDISQATLDLALQNALRLNAKVATVCSDLFTALSVPQSILVETGGDDSPLPSVPSFDIMVANLPYIAQDEPLPQHVLKDPTTALIGGIEGHEIIAEFLRQAGPYLAPEGIIFLEIGHDQGFIMQSLAQELGYGSCLILNDLAGNVRFCVIQ